MVSRGGGNIVNGNSAWISGCSGEAGGGWHANCCVDVYYIGGGIYTRFVRLF